jgi:hypothetical protein
VPDDGVLEQHARRLIKNAIARDTLAAMVEEIDAEAIFALFVHLERPLLQCRKDFGDLFQVEISCNARVIIIPKFNKNDSQAAIIHPPMQ